MRKVVLWGHHVAEYQAMFDLIEEDFTRRIFEFGCGTSALNATIKNKAKKIVSCDPLFKLHKTQLIADVQKMFQQRVEQIFQNPTELNVIDYGGIEAFIEDRRKGCELFFEDYEQGKDEKRYIDISTGQLPFANFSFDYVLSSHYFFSLDNASEEKEKISQHLKDIMELARIGSEIRIFPVMDRIGRISPLLGPVLLGLQQANFGVEVREVPYKLYPKGNAMLRVWAQVCDL